MKNSNIYCFKYDSEQNFLTEEFKLCWARNLRHFVANSQCRQIYFQKIIRISAGEIYSIIFDENNEEKEIKLKHLDKLVDNYDDCFFLKCFVFDTKWSGFGNGGLPLVGAITYVPEKLVELTAAMELSILNPNKANIYEIRSNLSNKIPNFQYYFDNSDEFINKLNE